MLWHGNCLLQVTFSTFATYGLVLSISVPYYQFRSVLSISVQLSISVRELVFQVVWHGNCLLQVTFSTFATYVLVDPSHRLTSDKIFVSITLMNIMRMPLNIFPMLIIAAVQVSLTPFAMGAEALVYYRQKNIIRLKKKKSLKKKKNRLKYMRKNNKRRSWTAQHCVLHQPTRFHKIDSSWIIP